MRSGNRDTGEMREIAIERGFTRNAAGSVLFKAGNTHVLCTASIDDRVPYHLRGTNQGWVTGEYSLLPGSTIRRSPREAARGRQGGRTMEIQRLIGRSLRSCIDLTKLGERTIVIDCDTLQADGGTRCASITGGYVALCDAVHHLVDSDKIDANPIHRFVAAVSVGIVNGEVLLDLDYAEDSAAETDMNFVMNEYGEFVEIQGTAEHQTFSMDQLQKMAQFANSGVEQLINAQKQALKEPMS